MRAGLHLHLFYPDIALELIDRVSALGPIEVIVTHAAPLDARVLAALDRLAAPVERLAVPNVGWDVAPLFAILDHARARGWEVIGHLHTKKGNSGYAAEWRALAYAGTLGGPGWLAQLETAFDADPALMLAGPRSLYKSAAAHQFANAELLSRLAPRLVAPLYPPSDWGFFAGSFFWARISLLERVSSLAGFSGEDAERDGTLAHALERLIGLAPVAVDGAIGLIDGEGAIATIHAPGRPSDEPIIRTLVAEAERATGPLNAELAALIAERNPLADYLRHGRDEDALDPNPYFSSSWYNRIHEDVYASGAHPFVHYVRHGAEEGRAAGPLFDGAFYRTRYPDVAGDSLTHFLATGAAEGRLAIPVTDRADLPAEGPRHFYRSFDIVREEAFLREMATLPWAAEAAAGTLVSVIMPAWNRAATIGAAIRSVLAQTHERFELIVVDDGSTDDTAAAVEPFLSDPRVRFVAALHGGVSAARNRGLAEATGEIVAYLDSDNRWVGWFLDVMVRFMRARGLEAAYSGIALRDDLGHLTGYRGADFDWDACLAQNYVDLNAYCHRRQVIGESGDFDTNLKRMVDWDLILRIGKGREVGYAPFVGCDYFDGKGDRHRITTGEPVAFQKLVRLKHERGLATGTPAFTAAVRFTFAIKIAAPEAEKAAWGDYHFAESLAASIERLGHRALIDFRDGWTRRPPAEEDVVIVLRGLLPHKPRPGQIAFLWAISHPDQIGFDEYDLFSRVYVASESHAALLRHLIRPPVTALLQATDPERFHSSEGPVEAGPPVLFVGNSRGVDREIVRWAIEAARPPEIHGEGWEGRVPHALLAGANIDNRELGRHYAAAGVVLNDHWPSMQAFGYLSNRLFDVVAVGGRAVSDAVPSMTSVFGDAVAQVDGPAALRRAVDRGERALDRVRHAAAVAAHHSFDARAAVLADDAMRMLGVQPPRREASAASAIVTRQRPLRVHVVAPHGPFGPQSSAYIRLLAPLTADGLADRVSVTLGRGDDPLPPCEACIVQRTALPSVEAADRLVATLGRQGAVLVTDVDDAFATLNDHPEAERYRPLAAALDRAIAASAESWFSSLPLARLYAHTAGRRWILPNALDPRLWRDWRNRRSAPFGEEKVRMLCMGTATHGEDFAMIRPALDRLWEERRDRFSVTIVGVAAHIDGAPWLSRLSPPADAIAYPRFVRWLRGQGPFDVGLAPLADTPFNRAKSDIKLLDYAALGLLPLVSDGPAYRGDAGFGDAAMFAGDWFEVLAGAIDDRDGARARAEAAERRLWTHRAVAGIAGGMVTRLEELVG